MSRSWEAIWSTVPTEPWLYHMKHTRSSCLIPWSMDRLSAPLIKMKHRSQTLFDSLLFPDTSYLVSQICYILFGKRSCLPKSHLTMLHLTMSGETMVVLDQNCTWPKPYLTNVAFDQIMLDYGPTWQKCYLTNYKLNNQINHVIPHIQIFTQKGNETLHIANFQFFPTQKIQFGIPPPTKKKDDITWSTKHLLEKKSE